MTELSSGPPCVTEEYCLTVRPKGVQRGSKMQLLMSVRRKMGAVVHSSLGYVTKSLQVGGSIATLDGSVSMSTVRVTGVNPSRNVEIIENNVSRSRPGWREHFLFQVKSPILGMGFHSARMLDVPVPLGSMTFLQGPRGSHGLRGDELPGLQKGGFAPFD